MADVILAQLEKGMDKLFLPLGLLYVANALEQEGNTVEIFHSMGDERHIDALLEKVDIINPDWVGFSTMTAPQLTPTIRASKTIKARTRVKIIWGGIHPTIVDGVENECYVDVAVKGEGEAWVTGSPVKEMDKFMPQWDKINAEAYGDIIHLVSSRGCPFRCGYCYSPVVWKCRWKAHSPEKMLEIFKAYPITPSKVEFRDDYFLVDVPRAIKIIKSLKTAWMGTIRADHLTKDFVKKLPIIPDSLSIGVETASERLLLMMNKDITKDDVVNALDVAEEFGITLYCSLIVDLPSETEKEKKDTIQLAQRITKQYKNAVCDVKTYRAYPKTAMYAMALLHGFDEPQNTEEWSWYAEKVWDAD